MAPYRALSEATKAVMPGSRHSLPRSDARPPMHPRSLPVTVACLTRVEALRDFGTNSHAHRVSDMIACVAHELGLSDAECRDFSDAGLLHDIGKLAIPLELLRKSSALSSEERALIRTHAAKGYEILSSPDDPFMRLAAEVALSHHERYDGTGYPTGISGDRIPLAAQVATICDVYDALRDHRPYRQGLRHETARAIILEGDGRTSPDHFAQPILAAFRRVSDQLDEIFVQTQPTRSTDD